MNAQAKIQATEVELIEEALYRLVLVAVSDVGLRRVRRSGAQTVGQVLQLCAEKDTWTPARRSADDLLDAPVGRAARDAINTLGRRLYEIGGTQLMLDAAERVSVLTGDYCRCIGVFEHQFDGIGDWVA